MERRVVPLENAEIRTDGDSLGFTGYAAVFNSLSEDLGGFREQIAPGAFKRTLSPPHADVRALINHDPNLVLGRNKAGTLRMEEDSRGLRVDVDLPDTSYARDLRTLLERGDVSQMSFGFEKVRDAWDDGTEPPTRTLEEVRLFDVSVVTFPAYPETSAEARAIAQLAQDEKPLDLNDLEALAVIEGEIREGKVLSSKNLERVRAALEALSTLLESADPEPQDSERDATTPEETTRLPLSILRKRAELKLKEIA